MRDIVLKTLDDNKAMDIVDIDLHNKTSIADYMIVASGTSSRQILSLAEKVKAELKKISIKSKLEGQGSADWVLLDAGDIIIHLFRPEVRDFYDIEKIWDIDFSKIDNNLHVST